MSKQENHNWIKHIDFMLIDLLTLTLSFLVAFAYKFKTLDFIHDGPWDGHWNTFLAVVLVTNVLITLFLNPYNGVFHRRFYEEIFRSFMLAFYNFLILCVFLYLFKMGEDYSREVFIEMYVLFVLLSLVVKYFWKRALWKGKIRAGQNRPKTLFLVMRYEDAEEILLNTMAEDIQKHEIKGLYFIDEHETSKYHGFNVCKEENDFVEYVIKEEIEEVLFSVRPSKIETASYNRLIENGINVQLNIESMLGFEADEQLVGRIGVYRTLGISRYTFTWEQKIYFVFKRILDFICALIGSICILPIALIIKISYLAAGDKNSIFYTQERVGKDGKSIRIYKFRSMVPNSAEILEELLKDEKYRKEWEENQKFTNDPRITPVGKFLRKTSLDEVPQFFNVLKGDMSLVGPRPLVPGELEDHNGLKLYNMCKPGITGWWGCNGRSNIEYKERLELEYYYVKNCSLYLDALCVFRTVFAVLEKDGAQ